MAGKYFDVPWAINGNKTAIPDANQPSGDVSYDEGWGPDYELDQVTEPSAKDVDRQKENQFKFDVTELLKEIQQNGLPVYNAVYNYLVGGYTIGTDGIIYRALIANGPATVVRNPVGDTTGSWLSNRGDIRDYVGTFDFFPDDFVKGSDGNLYRCNTANGPSNLPATDPVSDTTARWFLYKTDLSSYDAAFDYPVLAYAKGSDGVLYGAALANGPATSVVNPVGDLTGTWITISAAANAFARTVFTADDPAWVPNALTKSLKITVTGAGGGGGGVTGGAGLAAVASGGGAGGTGLGSTSTIDASYAVVVGAGGAGGAAGSNDGSTGALSSFNGASFAIITANGGLGGDGRTAASGSGPTLGRAGGATTGGDLNIAGGDSSTGVIFSGDISALSVPGSSFWGGGPFQPFGGVGIAATVEGTGGSGASSFEAGDHAGGAGADGVVVVEEYF